MTPAMSSREKRRPAKQRVAAIKFKHYLWFLKLNPILVIFGKIRKPNAANAIVSKWLIRFVFVRRPAMKSRPAAIAFFSNRKIIHE